MEVWTPSNDRGQLAVWDLSSPNRRRDLKTRDVKWADLSKGPCLRNDCHMYITEVGRITPIPMQNLGGSGCSSLKLCAECQGDCDRDSDCEAGLKCWQRNGHASV